MKLTRCSQGIITIYFILLVIAAFLDEPGLLFASTSTGIFLFFRYLLFINQVKYISDTCNINRIIGKRNIRQGYQVQVIVEITLMNTNNLEIRYNERKTPGLNIDRGKLVYIIPDIGCKPGIFSYWITPLTHGDIRFAGGELLISDNFFIFSLNLSGKKYTSPELKVQPVPRFGNINITNLFDGNDTNAFNLHEGLSIRSFREYLPGDDLRRIDWKLSAKHNTLYVRQFTNLQNNTPLIIIDLPEKDNFENIEGYQSILHSVTGLVDTSFTYGLSINLLLISGSNIIDSLIDEYELDTLMNFIRRKFHPSNRVNHLYRVKPRNQIRQDIKKLIEKLMSISNEEESKFYKKKISFLQKVLMNSDKMRFSEQISKILQIINPEEIFLFSLCEGDLSHIQEIILQARYQKVLFCLKTPLANNSHYREVLGNLISSERIEGVE